MAAENPQRGEAHEGKPRPIKESTIFIRQHFRKVLDSGAPVTPYRKVGDLAGVSAGAVYEVVKKTEGLQADLQSRRIEHEVMKQNEFFPKTQETAWFLGMLVGTGGSVDKSRGSLGYSSREDDTHTLDAFKLSGEFVLGMYQPPYDRPPLVGSEEYVKGNAHLSMIFSSKPHIRALGPFNKDERGDTIQERHAWVEEPEFIESYVSGIFDSGGKIRDGGKRIDFNTTNELLGDYYINLFSKLGILRARKEYQTRKREKTLRCVTIGTRKEVQKFASIVTSVNPRVKQQLESLQ